MASETLIIVIGGDYLALEICREILKTTGHQTVLLWNPGDDIEARKFRHEAAVLVAEHADVFTYREEDPVETGALERAGLHSHREADEPNHCLVAVSQNDRLNLRVALAARDIDDQVQITLRQFNPLLGHKIQEGLQYKCVAISPAAHAAATYAAAAVDPGCTYAMPFPTLETMVSRIAFRRQYAHESTSFRHEAAAGLFGFSERTAEQFGIAGALIPQAESRIAARIVGVNGKLPYLCAGDESNNDEELLARPLAADDRLVAFGAVHDLRDSWPEKPHWPEAYGARRFAIAWRDVIIGLRRTEPILRTVLLTSFAFCLAFVAFFTFAMHLNPLVALYFVITTMTTVGYGDITPCNGCQHAFNWRTDLPLIVAMFTMLTGLLSFAVVTATVTSALNSAQGRRLQGLRRINRNGHIIVCGSGNVGSLVIDYLREMGEQVVVIERDPDALLVELARDQKIDLLTGDATNDETIAYCRPEFARTLVGVTNSDTANLEAALGARSRVRAAEAQPLNVVLRIDDLTFGKSIERHFGIKSFSTTELTAPTIAGLARFETTRGRFDLFEGQDYARRFQLAERVQTKDNIPPPAPPERPGYKVRWVPLYVWREDAEGKGRAVPIHNFAHSVLPGDRLLIMVPLDQFA
jgi:Trk K+ transport system NAD-binding subunit